MKNAGQQVNSTQSPRIFTVPNAMSFFRIVLIPVFLWLYHFQKLYTPAVILLLLSFLSDLFDGSVARHLHQVSDFGKMLDPVADKLTQGVILLCLVFEFPVLLAPVILFVAKECFMGISNLLVIRKSREVHGAEMHGKVVTWLIDITILLHVLWHGIPYRLSVFLAAVCVIAMLISAVLYTISNRKWL